MTTILVVDDSSLDRRFVGGLLERQADYHVEFAEDGALALNRLKQALPDLVITDLKMPHRSGLELVDAVRLHYSQVPVILMTGHGSEDLAVKALRHGAASYIPKAQLNERLVDLVAEVLSLSRADRTYDRLISCLARTHFQFVLDNDPSLIDPLVDLVQQMVAGMGLTDATGRFRVGAAVKEALQNALFRGNLEFRFDELPDTRLASTSRPVRQLVEDRRNRAPYAGRRVQASVRIDQDEARFVICDDGPGFDPQQVPSPGLPGSLDPQIGRGLTLMRSFMDELSFNERGNEVTLVKRRESQAEQAA